MIDSLARSFAKHVVAPFVREGMKVAAPIIEEAVKELITRTVEDALPPFLKGMFK